MDISDTVAREIALSDACEDYTGLYELIWEFNTRFPHASSAERLRAAQAALRALLHEGLAAVYRTQWLSDEHFELATADAENAIGSPDSWCSPADRPDSMYFCFASTDEGDKRYFRRVENAR